ncbi:MAG: tRNA lysidine(34) synthetase TilS [Bacteroidia bacterium]
MFDFTKAVEGFIKTNNLFEKNDKLLVALSGGVDSVVLVHVLKNLGYNVSAAHVNFMLRDEESNRDELFVIDLCKKLNINLYTTKVRTKELSKNQNLSIQQTARNFRYSWLNKILTEQNLNKICTAHHANDVAETMLINFTRGTGIEGLIGIKAINNNIVRPLLNVSKKQIIEYATQLNINYVEDSSNNETKYTRNKIRHHVIPVLEEINPDFINTTIENSWLISAQHFFYKQYVTELIKVIVTKTNQQTIIDANKITSFKFSEILLFEIIKDFGFSSFNCFNIIQSYTNKQTGASFYSSTHKLLVNRNSFLVEPNTLDENKIIELSENYESINDGYYKLTFKTIQKNKLLNFKPNCLYLDKEKLKFPLFLKPIEPGMKFSPLGLKGKKKISDFLIDNKVNLFDKERAKVLISDGKIIAILPYQIDNYYKITDNTKHVYVIKIKEAAM